MKFKDILVYLDNHRGSEQRLQLAISIGSPNRAHLFGVYGFELPSLPAPHFMAATYVEDDVSRTTYIRERDAAFTALEQMESTFRIATNRAGLTGDWWISSGKAGDLATIVTERARYVDLVLLGQADPNHPLFDRLATLPETVMIGSGRPVLIVPYAERIDTFGKHILVAWSGTREGARAVGDTLTLLRSADRVTVVSIRPRSAVKVSDNQRAADLAQHLARHEIRAEALELAGDEAAASELILAQAAELGCDLIVMGGYGHSRTRELILGGVTRHVLKHMTVPVLMSH